MAGLALLACAVFGRRILFGSHHGRGGVFESMRKGLDFDSMLKHEARILALSCRWLQMYRKWLQLRQAHARAAKDIGFE